MLTCRDTLDDKIQGLDSGADDYVTKPFEFPELFARVRALLRRNPAGGSTILRVGEVTLNTLTREVKRREDAVKLTVREYAVLEYLMRHPGVVLTRGMIEDHVWNTSLFTPGSNLIDVHIGRLRTKLGDTEGALIEAVRGIGYRIKADG
jgi:DNA-binding response OmpR family regulator